MNALLKLVRPKVRSHAGPDTRSSAREEGDGRFAGLGIRGRYHVVKLHNLSTGGACLEMPVEPKIGERVKVTSGTLNRTGRVCWVARRRSGVEFE